MAEIDPMLLSCLVKVYCDFEDMKLQPGKESWVRHPDCQAKLISAVRDIWIEEGQGTAEEWPWNDHYILMEFIRVRKMNQTKKEELRNRMEQGMLFPVPQQGIIYFIRNSRGNVKIGWTASEPEKRLRALQTAESEPLTLVGWMPGSQRQERALHVRFAAFRKTGEWFHTSLQLEEIIKENRK